MDKRIIQLKEQLVVLYANSCMSALKEQGVRVGDGGKFYEQLIDLIDNSISFGDIRI